VGVRASTEQREGVTGVMGEPTERSHSLPTFLIIGAMKCGTTSLHDYLGEHPQIQMSAVKETNFFSGPPEGNPYTKGSERTERLEDYERLFDPAIGVRGEASPSYTAFPRRQGVPERIKEIVPDAKFVYLVRDPVERLLSHYHHSLSVDGERQSLREALGDFSDPECPFTCPGFYAAQLDRYLSHFDKERILVVDQADLLLDRQATLREIFAFLEVEPSFVSPRFDEELNMGKELRGYSRTVVLLRRAKTRVAPLWRTLPLDLRRRLRSSVQRLAAPPIEKTTLDPELRKDLQELYVEDARRLRQLTGKTLPSWSV
jgi:hypothetical protein